MSHSAVTLHLSHQSEKLPFQDPPLNKQQELVLTPKQQILFYLSKCFPFLSYYIQNLGLWKSLRWAVKNNNFKIRFNIQIWNTAELPTNWKAELLLRDIQDSHSCFTSNTEVLNRFYQEQCRSTLVQSCFLGISETQNTALKQCFASFPMQCVQIFIKTITEEFWKAHQTVTSAEVNRLINPIHMEHISCFC